MDEGVLAAAGGYLMKQLHGHRAVALAAALLGSVALLAPTAQARDSAWIDAPIQLAQAEIERGVRGEGRGRPERGERPERAERGERPQRMERGEQFSPPRRPDRMERDAVPQRRERGERSERGRDVERPDRAERRERMERPDRAERRERMERRDRGERRREGRTVRRFRGPRVGYRALYPFAYLGPWVIVRGYGPGWCRGLHRGYHWDPINGWHYGLHRSLFRCRW